MADPILLPDNLIIIITITIIILQRGCFDRYAFFIQNILFIYCVYHLSKPLSVLIYLPAKVSIYLSSLTCLSILVTHSHNLVVVTHYWEATALVDKAE